MDQKLRDVLKSKVLNSIRKDCKNNIKEHNKELKERKASKPTRPLTEYSLFVKSHAGNSFVNGVDYKGKPQEKMKALGEKWKKVKNTSKVLEKEPLNFLQQLEAEKARIASLMKAKLEKIAKRKANKNIIKFDDLPKVKIIKQTKV